MRVGMKRHLCSGNPHYRHGVGEKTFIFTKTVPQRSASPAESINSGDSRRIFIISFQTSWREHVQTAASLLLMPVVFAGTKRIAEVDRPVFPAPTARSRSVGQMR